MQNNKVLVTRIERDAVKGGYNVDRVSLKHLQELIIARDQHASEMFDLVSRARDGQKVFELVWLEGGVASLIWTSWYMRTS